jgi:cytochrome c oxidase cbb3-type subunit 3
MIKITQCLSGLLILALLTPSFMGCAKKSEAVASGQAQFIGYGCNTCHTIGGQGGTLGPDLTYIGFRKSHEWLDLWLQNPEEWKHSTLMPNFYLKDHVRKQMVDYLVSLKGEAYRQNPPWNKPELMQDPIARGKTIFTAAGCVGCHGVEGKGGYPNNNVVGGQIPGLTTVADGFSKEELKDRIKKGRETDPADLNAPHPMIKMPAWGEVLTNDELEALVEYLYSIRPPISEDDDEW